MPGIFAPSQNAGSRHFDRWLAFETGVATTAGSRSRGGALSGPEPHKSSAPPTGCRGGVPFGPNQGAESKLRRGRTYGRSPYTFVSRPARFLAQRNKREFKTPPDARVEMARMFAPRGRKLDLKPAFDIRCRPHAPRVRPASGCLWTGSSTWNRTVRAWNVLPLGRTRINRYAVRAIPTHGAALREPGSRSRAQKVCLFLAYLPHQQLATSDQAGPL